MPVRMVILMMEETYVVRTRSSDEKLVQEKRQLIVKCAIELFAEKGFKATTVRELAEACGMAQGSIYHYIGAKEDILHLVVAGAGAGGTLLRDYLKRLGAISATEALSACIREYYRWADQDQENYIFFNREILHFSADDRRLLLNSQVEIIRVFEDLLKKGTEQGEFKASHPFLIAHNIVVQGFDWAMRRWYLKDYFTLEEYTNFEIDLLMKQLGIGSRRSALAVKTAA